MSRESQDSQKFTRVSAPERLHNAGVETAVKRWGEGGKRQQGTCGD